MKVIKVGELYVKEYYTTYANELTDVILSDLKNALKVDDDYEETKILNYYVNGKFVNEADEYENKYKKYYLSDGDGKQQSKEVI